LRCMMKVAMTFLLFWLAFSIWASVAEADTFWHCSYRGSLGSDVDVTFSISGMKITDELTSFHVEQNNEFGIVAIYSFSYFDKDSKDAAGLNLGAFIFLIDKTNLKFKQISLVANERIPPVEGTCREPREIRSKG
jgi:hypothetical protein